MSLPRELIIAIDGPSGAGKSTLSRLLARRLNYVNIDTGAMYRTVAFAARRQNIPPEDEQELARLCHSIQIRFSMAHGRERVFLDDRDVTEDIRSPEISLLTSRVAAVPRVRQAMVDQQRRLGIDGGVVLEGRDIGTVVFPQAEVKFYLQASCRERGRRRYEELRAKGIAVELEQTIAEVAKRDRADAEREHSPLRQAIDALVVDTDGVSVETILQNMLEVVEKRRKMAGLPAMLRS